VPIRGSFSETFLDTVNMKLLILLFVFSACHALIPPAAVVHTACAFVAGSAGAVAAYPIDFVKSQLQTEEGRAKYSGGLEAAMDIVKEDGVLALYRGVMVNIVGVAPEKTIKLSINDAARLAITSHFGYLPIAGEIVAGGFAGMMQVTVTNPLEVVKVRMQTSKRTVQEILKELKTFGDLYQGAGACVARDMIFSATLFPLYAHAKAALAAVLITTGGSTGDAGMATFWGNMLAGSLAAAPAAIIATPPDVVKTRMQQVTACQNSAFEDPLEVCPIQSTSAVETLKTLLEEEGSTVLFSGWAERCVRSVPQFGVTLSVFDVLNQVAVEHGWILAK
jgi:solute carrier family 25 aspartate/glutamate transporter 12/13